MTLNIALEPMTYHVSDTTKVAKASNSATDATLKVMVVPTKERYFCSSNYTQEQWNMYSK